MKSKPPNNAISTFECPWWRLLGGRRSAKNRNGGRPNPNSNERRASCNSHFSRVSHHPLKKYHRSDPPIGPAPRLCIASIRNRSSQRSFADPVSVLAENWHVGAACCRADEASQDDGDGMPNKPLYGWPIDLSAGATHIVICCSLERGNK